MSSYQTELPVNLLTVLLNSKALNKRSHKQLRAYPPHQKRQVFCMWHHEKLVFKAFARPAGCVHTFVPERSLKATRSSETVSDRRSWDSAARYFLIALGRMRMRNHKSCWVQQASSTTSIQKRVCTVHRLLHKNEYISLTSLSQNKEVD